MSGPSALDPSQQPAATDSQSQPQILVADSGVKSGRAGEPYSSPPSPGPESPPMLPPSPAQSARDKVRQYLEDIGHGGNSSVLRANAQMAASADADAQRAALSKLNPKLGVELFEQRKIELNGNIDEAELLQALARGIPPLEAPRRVAEIRDMELRATIFKLAEDEASLSAATRKLANTLAKHNPEEKRNAAAEVVKAMKQAEATIKLADSARDRDVAAWRSAQTTAKKNNDTDEFKACNNGYLQGGKMRESLQAQVNGLRELWALAARVVTASAKPMAPDAAKAAQLAFHDAELRWLKETGEIRHELARKAAAEAAAHGQRQANDQADADRRALNTREAVVHEGQHQKAELNKVAANERSVQEQVRRAAELGKYNGSTSPGYD